MDLKERGREIDAALVDECSRWRLEVRELERIIEEQDRILQSDEAKGDRSENAVFQNAADAKQQAMMNRVVLEEKIRVFENAFDSYSTEKYVSTGVIRIGSVVRITIPKINKEMTVKIVPKQSDAPMKGAISATSPLGRALLNKQAGDRVEYRTERGLWVDRIQEVY